MEVITEETFWERYSRQRRKMSYGCGIFELLKIDNAKGRAQRNKADAKYLKKTLPPTSLSFYNDSFKTVDRTVQKLLRKHKLPKESLALAKSAYGVRLDKGTTYSDLLELDAFHNKTYNQDLRPEDVFGGYRQRAKKNTVRFLAYHLFLHRPQRTEHVLFHEVIVGYLLDTIFFGGQQAQRDDLLLKSPEGESYLHIANHLVERLAKLNHLNVGQLVVLHLEEPEVVNSVLTPCTKELMLAGAELYLYLDLFSRWARKFSAADILELIYNFFLLPFVERELEEPGWRLRPSASRKMDDIIKTILFKHYPKYGEGIGDPEVARVICKCFENVWYKPRRS